jgi:hypothetical protein
MFVSSYNTYVDTSSSRRVQNDRQENSKKADDSFSSKYRQTAPQESLQSQTQSKLPLNYISNYKSLSTKQQIEQQAASQNNEQSKFTKVSAQTNAKTAYEDNSRMFSFLVKPKVPLDLTPKIDKKLPEEAMKGKESALKTEMLNTYIANDNYYKITAA